MRVAVARSLDISAVVMVSVMVRVRITVSLWMRRRMSRRRRIGMRTRIGMRIASVFGFSHANVDAASFSTGRPFRNACKILYCNCFPAYISSDGPSREMRHRRACNGDIQVLDMLILLAAELSAAMLAELAVISAET